MAKKITLQEALDAWMEWRLSREEGVERLSADELYQILVDPQSEDHREILARLDGSALDHRELKDMLESLQEARERMRHWDLALPRAAASPGEEARKIYSQGGKYLIEIRPHVSDPRRGIITVQVAAPHREDLEGKSITLKDSGRRILLKGRVINGEVSQEIDDLQQIEYGFVIQAE